MSDDSEADAARIRALEQKVEALQAMIDERHNFSLYLFSCVINLWALALEIRGQLPDGVAKSIFLKELSELQSNINKTQAASDAIVGSIREPA